jgi:copper transport protein
MTRRLRAAIAGVQLVLAVLAVLATVAALLVLGPAPAAEAHTFLVRTQPAQGQRLTEAPREVSLEFSEPFNDQGARLELTVDGRREPLVPERTLDGRVLRADVAATSDGVYTVSWQVVAQDGHQAAGEFAFGVGAAGDIPASRGTSAPVSWVRVVAGLLFFAGLALAAGNLAAQWTQASSFRPTVMAWGLGIAQTGALIAWVDALVNEEPTRQRLLLATAAGSLALALPWARHRRRWPVTLAVAGAAIAWSARGHDAVINGLLGAVVDTTHLVAGATWVGALVLLVIDLRQGAGTDDGGGRLAVARRYARLAAILVAVLAVAGIGAAVLLLDRPSDLWATGYGRLLAVKTGLFAAALALAATSRRALRRGRITRLRRTTPVEAGLVAGVLAVTAVLINVAPPAASTSGEEISLLGPAPLTGPVVRDAGLAGNLTVAVTAGRDQLRVEVFAPGGQPPTDVEVDLEAELPDGAEQTLLPRPCGPGCFTQRIQLPAGTTRLTVTASAPDWPSGFHVAELDTPPPPSDPTLLRDLAARMRAVPTVSFVETTTSGPGSTVTPAAFTLSGQQFVDLEPWAAGTADDIQPLGQEGGFRMYLPGERIWITFWQDDQGRIIRERIVALNHEIERDEFRYLES